ncbi:MAG: lysophospholipid acyltransferase family protein [Pseudooceanicola sp.]
MTAPTGQRKLSKRIGDHAITAVLLGVLGLMRALPYATRVRVFGWFAAHVVAPLAGWPRRIRRNLDLAWPELGPEEVARLVREVPDRIGRTVVEFWFGEDLRKRLSGLDLEGPGVAELEAGMKAGRPMVLVSGHIGNYMVFRALMAERYGGLGGLYRPLSNAPFNRHYVAAMESTAKPLFPRSRRGLAEMVKYLRDGHAVAILHDQHMDDGAPLTFFGKVAKTALSPAEMALKYDALLIPVYTIRQPDGLSFRITVEAPVPRGAAEEMMQQVNDSLEVQVRAHPEQWLWTHRRWRAAGG